MASATAFLPVLIWAGREVDGRITFVSLRANRRRLLSVHGEEGDALITRGAPDHSGRSRCLGVSRFDLEVIWAVAQLRVCRTRFVQFEMLTQFERQLGVRGDAGASVLHGGTDCVPGNEELCLGRQSPKELQRHSKGLIVVLEVETLGKSRPRDFFPRDGGRLSGSSSEFRPVKSQPAQALSRSSPCWGLSVRRPGWGRIRFSGEQGPGVV